MIVRLTSSELLIAWHIAGMRSVSNLKFSTKPRYGAPVVEGLDEPQIVACQGEMAVAKALNLFWSGSVNDFKAHDVGGIVEVRTCRNDRHSLILHPPDRDEAPYVLVRAAAPEFVLVGWVLGRDGKMPEFWKDPVGGRPAFFVPGGRLRPMLELKEHLRRAA